MRRFFPALTFTGLLFIGLLLFGTDQITNARDTHPDIDCMGKVLATYMNTVIRGAGDLDNIKILSPAFAIVSANGIHVFQAMQDHGALFGQLDGFAANIYTAYGDTAYNHYTMDRGGMSWKSLFDSYPIPVLFTEFGDFGLAENPPGSVGRLETLDRLKSQFNLITASENRKVIALNFFNALKSGSSQFDPHQILPYEISYITDNNPKHGINSAMVVNPSFPDQVANLNIHTGWIVELVVWPSDLTSAILSINNAHEDGLIPILRICFWDTCGFRSPDQYVEFLRQLNGRISGPVWIIAGTNEPSLEPWATETTCDSDRNSQCDCRGIESFSKQRTVTDKATQCQGTRSEITIPPPMDSGGGSVGGYNGAIRPSVRGNEPWLK